MMLDDGKGTELSLLILLMKPTGRSGVVVRTAASQKEGGWL